MKLTDKQREALIALRDVMVKYDIEVYFTEDYDYLGFDILSGDFATKQTEYGCIDIIRGKENFSHEDLTELLEQE